MKLPNELKQFDSRYDIALAEGVFCAVNGTASIRNCKVDRADGQRAGS